MSYPQPNNGQYSYPPMSGINNPSPGYYEPPRYQPTPQPQTIYIQQQQPQKKNDDCCAAFTLFLSSLLPSSTRNTSSSLYKDKSSTPTATKDIHVKSQHSQLTNEKLLLLYSALGHMKIGYVTNCTPDIDTPPLTIMYSCKLSLMGCG
ncbi:unnamed protein product [Cunninghamella echinulata]